MAKQVGIRLTDRDHRALSAAAATAGFKTVAMYLRICGLAAAKRPDELEILKKEAKNHGE